MLIGFEFYEPALEMALKTERESEGTEGSTWKSVAVLWLNSEDFRTCALSKVSALTAFLDRGRPPEKFDQATTALVGPVTSGELSKLKPAEPAGTCEEMAASWLGKVQEVVNPETARGQVNASRERLHVLSPRATAPLDLLFHAASSPTPAIGDVTAGEKTAIENCLKARSVVDAPRADKCLAEYLDVASFESVVARDDVVLRRIVDELRARGASRLLMAVVSEQDFAYGRLLDDVLKEVLPGRDGGDGPAKERFEVREYGYLAGVDGEMPPSAVERDPAPKSGVEPTVETLMNRRSLIRRGHEEVAFGEARLDYVRRLADRIADDLWIPRDDPSDAPSATGADLGNASRTAWPVAIGVLGSDVYDKLLILQALCARLPAATYFTTDLDARLSHPDEYSWTRNLIVGSAYGLTVNGLESAAFRDSYQTATYRAVSLALETHQYGRLLYSLAAPEPRLFEIGRTGPVDITEHGSKEARAAYEEMHGRAPYVRSKSVPSRRFGLALFVLAPLLALIIFALASRRALPDEGAELRRRARLNVAYVGGASAGVLGLLMWAVRDGYEPWPFLEGVSSLPTLVLYLTTLVYAYAVVSIAMARIAQAEKGFAEDWGLAASAAAPSSHGSALRRWLRLGNWKQDATGVTTAFPEKPAAECWAEYSNYSSWSARLIRVSIPLCISIVVLLAIVFGFSLPGPLLTRRLDGLLSVTGHLTTIAILFAVFFCDDALRLGRAMVREIGRHQVVDWPGVERNNVTQCWRTMRFLERFTDSVMPIAAFPFVLLALLIVARSTLFEGWVWTTEILLLYAAFVIHVVVRILRFQFEAVRAKEAILTCLDRYRLDNLSSAVEKERVEIVKERIEGVNRGAFGPWTRHPILRSVLVPTLAYALVVLLEAWL